MALGRLRDELQALVGGFEPGMLTASEAVAAVELFAEVKRLAEAGQALAAKRVDETSAWRAAGARSASHFLAGRTGESPGHVGRMVDTARKLDRLGDTADAVRAGRVSIEQAAAIAGAAAIDPGCERDLLDTARHTDLGSLKQAAARARAAGDRHDEQRHVRQRAAREFRMWVDDEGMGNARWRTTPEEYAELQAIHERFRDEAFEAARTAGRRDPERHLASEGFARLMRAAAGGEQRDDAPAKKDVRLFVLVSDTALLRGRTEPGETCEIAGTGPVPVSVARQVCGPNPFVSIIETDGTDVHRVVRAGRRIAPEIRDALFVRDRGCVVPGCTTTRRLEVHHVVPYAESRQTRLDELATVCSHHHDRISHDGAVLAGGPASGTGDPHLDPTTTPEQGPDPNGEGGEVGRSPLGAKRCRSARSFPRSRPRSSTSSAFLRRVRSETMTNKIGIVVIALMLGMVFPFAESAAGAEFSGSVTLGCEGYTSTGDLTFDIDSGDGTETVRAIAIDAAYSDPIITPSVTLLDTTITGEVGTSEPLGDAAWATAPTHNPLFLSLSVGADIWATFGICEGLPWATPLLGILGSSTGGALPPGAVFTLVIASCWGTTAEVTFTQGGQVIGGVQFDVFTLPPGGPLGSFPLENFVDVPIPSSAEPGELTARVVCGSEASPLSPPASLDLQVAAVTPSTPPAGPPPTASPRFTG